MSNPVIKNSCGIEQAIEIINRGGIIIFPTDTAFGVGCIIDKVDSIKKLNKILKRPAGMPLPILVSSIKMAKQYFLSIPKTIEKLMQNYWPGGLTIIYYCKPDLIPDTIRTKNNTLGLRMPDHSTLLKLIRKIKKPLIGTSANFHGEPTPYSSEDLNKKLIQQVNGVIKGTCPKKEVSTIIDCTKKPWKILRQGTVKLSEKFENENFTY